MRVAAEGSDYLAKADMRDKDTTGEQFITELEEMRRRVADLEQSSTEGKPAGLTLWESYQFNKQIISSATEGITAYDRELKYLVWNRFMEELSGLTADKVLGKHAKDLFPHLVEHGVYSLLKRAVMGETVASPDVPYYVPQTGRSGWVSGKYGPLRNASGEIIGAIGLVRDVTERKKVEELLKESEGKNRTIIEYTYDFICETTIDGRFLYVNPKHKDLLEYEPSELVGRSVFEFIHPDDRSGAIAEFQRAAVNRCSGQAVFRFRHKNGQWRWFESTGKPFQTATGELRGIISSRDITERKEAEQTQVRLLKELESANQELNDFAHVVSHDLKAPLRAISSLANWIATDYSDRLDENGKEQLNLLVGRVRRMHHLIDGILDYSRLGRIKEEKAEVDLNELVAEVSNTIAPPEHIHVKIQNLPLIHCDRTRMEQVFQNLLSNAVKFMDKKMGEVSVGCVEDSAYWTLYILDNGPGIEERNFEKIFQIFQTFGRRDESESTGVGLAVVKKIIEMAGGKIWVESKVGCGSTFFFTVPK
jgi:PAS domain S-box-containing protein